MSGQQRDPFPVSTGSVSPPVAPPNGANSPARPSTSPAPRSHRRRGRVSARLARWLLILFALGLVTRLALPSVVKSYVNRQLDRMPDYDGRVGDIRMQLWRGAYQIRSVEIVKTTADVPAPLFAADEVDLSVQWRELFHGSLVGEVTLRRPAVHFVAGPSAAETQTWGEMLASLFPFELNRFAIERGTVHFRNFHSTPPVDIFIHDVTAQATNLTNSRDLTQPLPAGLFVRGSALGGGDLDLELRMNPLAPAPTFEISGQLTNVNLVALNDFLRAYGKFDVERGRFALFASFAAAEGKFEGYAKVFFENLDVFAWEKERKKNALEVFWHAIVGGVTTVFRNHPQDRLATKIPISGSFESTDVGLWSAAIDLLRNAFVRALVPNLDKSVRIEEVREPTP